jgi:23S rRNA (cytosine1962-C5)-methyltransferase
MGKLITSGKGRRWLQSGHPWLYADDIADGRAEPGELVPVFGPNEVPLGWGLYSNASRIALRLVTRSPEQPDRAFWVARIEQAIAWRERLGWLGERGACRLLHGDAEHVPGLVVDRYADTLVLQSGCQGSDRMRDFLLGLLLERLPCGIRHVLDRSDGSVRRLDGLEARVEWLRGGPQDSLVVEESGGLSYEVDVLAGHKTGHYLDQRENRRLAATFAAGQRVLDAFSYDGLFGLRCALAGAAEVLCLDQAAAAGERLRRNAERNGVAHKIRFERVNVMHDLRDRAQRGEAFGLVIVDPPAFARNRREAEGAARGYRELNLRAMKLLQQGGFLVSASCSYNVSRSAFEGFLSAAANDARVEAQLLQIAGAAADHPVALGLPESEYLKCAVLRIGVDPLQRLSLGSDSREAGSAQTPEAGDESAGFEETGDAPAIDRSQRAPRMPRSR